MYRNKTAQRQFILIFLFLFEVAFLLLFTHTLFGRLTGMNLQSLHLLFDSYWIEFVLVYVMVFLLLGKNSWLHTIGVLLALLFVGIVFSQYISYSISSDFITQTALNNVEFIGFLFTTENSMMLLKSIGILLLIPVFISYFLSKHGTFFKPLFSFLVLFLFISSALWLLYSRYYETPTLTQKRHALLIEKHLGQTPPLLAFFSLFQKHATPQTFSKQELEALQKVGITLNTQKAYPLMHYKSYQSEKHFNSSIEKPNIILIFTEGLSARTTSIYNNKFATLTPQLQAFAEDNKTMIVKDYYNHTAATYKGLHGQLCSLYPTLGGKQWNKSIPHSEEINYQCLGHILQDDGYQTTYLNVHYKDASGNDEMASHLGFHTVLSAEDLIEKYIGKTPHYREHELTDHQAYSALTGYLKAYHQEKPLFLSIYTAETHAWCDISEDGKRYKTGKNAVLNTIHNMDDAFGTFWHYFKDSRYAKNTIVIFTSDHAHYFDKEYYQLMTDNKERYHKVFIDKVPLLVYAPNLTLPDTLQSYSATSIDLAPTLLHLISKQKVRNAFLGHTIFKRTKDSWSLAAYDTNIYFIEHNHLHYNKLNVKKEKPFFNTIAKFFNYENHLELSNAIFKR